MNVVLRVSIWTFYSALLLVYLCNLRSTLDGSLPESATSIRPDRRHTPNLNRRTQETRLGPHTDGRNIPSFRRLGCLQHGLLRRKQERRGDRSEAGSLDAVC